MENWADVVYGWPLRTFWNYLTFKTALKIVKKSSGFQKAPIASQGGSELKCFRQIWCTILQCPEHKIGSAKIAYVWIIRDHPYITSGYFGTFRPAHVINTLLNVSENGQFLNSPTQSFYQRNTEMVPNYNHNMSYFV